MPFAVINSKNLQCFSYLHKLFVKILSHNETILLGNFIFIILLPCMFNYVNKF